MSNKEKKEKEQKEGEDGMEEVEEEEEEEKVERQGRRKGDEGRGNAYFFGGKVERKHKGVEKTNGKEKRIE